MLVDQFADLRSLCKKANIDYDGALQLLGVSPSDLYLHEHKVSKKYKRTVLLLASLRVVIEVGIEQNWLPADSRITNDLDGVLALTRLYNKAYQWIQK